MALQHIRPLAPHAVSHRPLKKTRTFKNGNVLSSYEAEHEKQPPTRTVDGGAFAV